VGFVEDAISKLIVQVPDFYVSIVVFVSMVVVKYKLIALLLCVLLRANVSFAINVRSVWKTSIFQMTGMDNAW
jgi:hypothetical protein